MQFRNVFIAVFIGTALLLAAVLHACWNALIKAGGDHLVMTTVIMFVPILPSIAILAIQPAMAAAAWPYVILSAVVHWFYFGVLIGAYRYGDLSQVYPIARGTAPALVAFAAWIFEGETLTAIETLGALIVSAGIVSLAWRRRGGKVPAHEPKAIGFALLTALSIAIYLLADGMGGRRSGGALVYICWLFVLQGVPLVAFTLWRRRGRMARRRHLPAPGRGRRAPAPPGGGIGARIGGAGASPAHRSALRAGGPVGGSYRRVHPGS